MNTILWYRIDEVIIFIMAFNLWGAIHLGKKDWLDTDKNLVLTLLHESCHTWQIKSKPIDIRRLTRGGRQILELEASLNAYARSGFSINVILDWELGNHLMRKYGLTKAEFVRALQKV